MSKRIERVNSLIKRELGQIILREIELPDNTLVTLTRVESSIDLANAKIYIAVLPSDQTGRVLNILSKMVYELQKMLDRRLKMRPVPKIRFVEEEQNMEAAKVEEILQGLKNEEK